MIVTFVVETESFLINIMSFILGSLWTQKFIDLDSLVFSFYSYSIELSEVIQCMGILIYRMTHTYQGSVFFIDSLKS